MSPAVFAFHWPVREGGHEWIRGHVFTSNGGLDVREQWLLTDNLIVGDAWGVIQEPLRTHPALHVTFANLDWKSRDDIRIFANRFGMLGIGQQTDAKAPDGSDAPRKPVEPLPSWQREILDMREAIFVQDVIRTHDLAKLSTLITWERGVCRYRINGPKEHVQVVNPTSAAGNLFREGDLIMPAQILFNGGRTRNS